MQLASLLAQEQERVKWEEQRQSQRNHVRSQIMRSAKSCALNIPDARF